MPLRDGLGFCLGPQLGLPSQNPILTIKSLQIDQPLERSHRAETLETTVTYGRGQNHLPVTMLLISQGW